MQMLHKNVCKLKFVKSFANTFCKKMKVRETPEENKQLSDISEGKFSVTDTRQDPDKIYTKLIPVKKIYSSKWW